MQRVLREAEPAQLLASCDGPSQRFRAALSDLVPHEVQFFQGSQLGERPSYRASGVCDRKMTTRYRREGKKRTAARGSRKTKRGWDGKEMSRGRTCTA
mmetsp:Transcript_44464/g.90760  ORF Transcript_44464/g.90760 Transcript_44464/m.90760 type:complete len:98 (-) Transcript_44464:1036-1329(-)